MQNGGHNGDGKSVLGRVPDVIDGEREGWGERQGEKEGEREGGRGLEKEGKGRREVREWHVRGRQSQCSWD